MSGINTYLVQHEWDERQTESVKKVVTTVIENAQTGKLPKGFDLIGVMLSKEEPKALCVWEAESRQSLEGLLKAVNPPSRHTVSQYDTIYGAVRAQLA